MCREGGREGGRGAGNCLEFMRRFWREREEEWGGKWCLRGESFKKKRE